MIELTRARVESAREAVNAAQATIELYTERLDDTVIRAPTEGRILFRLVEPGEVAPAGGGLMTLLDINDVYMLETFARSMPQFGLLATLIIVPFMMRSGGHTPVESQPEWLQTGTVLLPSRHFTTFMHGVFFRGAG